MNPEYETLTVPGTSAEYRYTIVDARVLFRFAGEHTQAAALAEVESRLALLPGIDITGMGSRAPLADTADLIVVAPADPPLPETAREYARRITVALDALAYGVAAGAWLHSIDKAVRALTGDGTPASTYRQWREAHPGWAERMSRNGD